MGDLRRQRRKEEIDGGMLTAGRGGTVGGVGEVLALLLIALPRCINVGEVCFYSTTRTQRVPVQDV